MRVWVHPADENACGFYRVIAPAKALQDQGHDVTILYDFSYKRTVWRDTAFGPTVVGLDQTIDADVVVLQRPLHRNRVELISVLQEMGVAVVVEVDDDFHAVHPRNPAWRGSNPLNDPDRNREWLLKACKRADLVTVTTPALAERYGAHGRVAILPNYVPESYTRTTPGAYSKMFMERPKGLLLGWSGSVATHPDDLQVTGDAIPAVLRETGAKFHVVGTGVGVANRLGLESEPTATGWVPLEAYPEAMAQLDVGIVPLSDTPFNSAKSALKMMEFAAVGVPSVGSPTPDNVRLVNAGVGWLATERDSWSRLPWNLLTDHVLREELSIEWQQRVRDDFTIEANAWRWAEQWERAMQNRRAVAA